MRAQLATATAVLLALPLVPAATAKPAATRPACGIRDPRGDAGGVPPYTNRFTDKVDITGFDVTFGPRTIALNACVVDPSEDPVMDLQITVRARGREYRTWGPSASFDRTATGYRVSFPAPGVRKSAVTLTITLLAPVTGVVIATDIAELRAS